MIKLIGAGDSSATHRIRQLAILSGLSSQRVASSVSRLLKGLEAAIGIEPMNKGFAALLGFSPTFAEC